MKRKTVLSTQEILAVVKTLSLIVYFFSLVYFSCAGQDQHEIESLERFATTSSIDTIRVNASYELAKKLLFSDSERALNYAMESLRLALELDYKIGIAKIYNLLGVLANFRGLSAQATEYYEKAIPIFNELRNTDGVAKCYTNLAIIYSIERKHALAEDYFRRSLAIQHHRKDTLAIANVLSNLGAEYHRQKEYYKAVNEYQNALALIRHVPENTEVRNITTGTMINIAMVNLDVKNYSKASEYLTTTLTLSREHNNKYLQSHALITLAQLQLDIGKPVAALHYATEGLSVASSIKHVRRVSELYNVMSNAYRAMGDYKNSFIYQSRNVRLSDSIQSYDNSSKADTKRIELAIQRKMIDVKLLQEEYESGIQKRNIIVAVAFILCGVLSLAYLRFRQNSKAKEEANNQEKERKRMQLDLVRTRLIEKSELYEKLNKELKKLSVRISKEFNNDDIDQFNGMLKSKIITDGDWESFKRTFDKLYPSFFAAIRYRYPSVTLSDLRLCACIKISLSLRESANLLGISEDSVKQARYRLKKKLTLNSHQTLDDFIQKMDKL